MIRYPVQPPHSDAEDALRILIKIIVYTYLVIAGALALIAGVMIVGLTAAYVILRLVTRILAMLLHKHVGFSLQDALFSLLRQTRQYYAGQEV